MRYVIIIFLALAGTAWLNRVWLEAHLYNFIVKLKGGKDLREQNHKPDESSIFSPVGTTRKFIIAIEIEELGGKVDIRLAKIPKDSKIKE